MNSETNDGRLIASTGDSIKANNTVFGFAQAVQLKLTSFGITSVRSQRLFHGIWRYTMTLIRSQVDRKTVVVDQVHVCLPTW